jgi:restriction system protein
MAARRNMLDRAHEKNVRPTMKRLWLVRLGKNGEQEARALEHAELVLGFHVGSLAVAKDRDAVLAIVKSSFPDLK